MRSAPISSVAPAREVSMLFAAFFGCLYISTNTLAAIGQALAPGASVMTRLKSLVFDQSAVAAAAAKDWAFGWT